MALVGEIPVPGNLNDPRASVPPPTPSRAIAPWNRPRGDIAIDLDHPDIAKASGAEHVGGKDLADKIKEGWTDFDVAIATPDMMGIVGRLGKILGPRGLMPNPRLGTVTMDVKGAVTAARGGQRESVTRITVKFIQLGASSTR